MHHRDQCIALAFLLATIAGGCAVGPDPQGVLATGAIEPVSLVYELRQTGATPLMHPHAKTLNSADGEAAGQAVRLQITRSGERQARAIVVVTEATGERRAYELILPLAELTLAVDRLTQDQLPKEGDRPGGHARIEIGFGSTSVTREWTPEPRLDDIAERTIREGRRIPLGRTRAIGVAQVI